MTHFTDCPQIEEMNELLYRDEVMDLIESEDIWDLEIDDSSVEFAEYLSNDYDY